MTAAPVILKCHHCGHVNRIVVGRLKPRCSNKKCGRVVGGPPPPPGDRFAF